MSKRNEISTDSNSDRTRQRKPDRLQSGNVDEDAADKSPTFIVTDPDSDIETDAAPDPPRPRGTPIPGPPKPENVLNGEPLHDEEIPDKSASFSKSSTKSRKIPKGFFDEKTPRGSGNRIFYNVSNSNNVHFGNNIVIGANLRQPMGSQENEEVIPPSEYEILLSSKKIVNDHHLDCVADNIGRKWRKLGLLLGMKEGALDRIKEDYQGDHRERVYQLLMEWKQSTGGPNQAPLLARLSTALWQLREKEVLDSLVKLEKDPRLNDE